MYPKLERPPCPPVFTERRTVRVRPAPVPPPPAASPTTIRRAPSPRAHATRWTRRCPTCGARGPGASTRTRPSEDRTDDSLHASLGGAVSSRPAGARATAVRAGCRTVAGTARRPGAASPCRRAASHWCVWQHRERRSYVALRQGRPRRPGRRQSAREAGTKPAAGHAERSAPATRADDTPQRAPPPQARRHADADRETAAPGHDAAGRPTAPHGPPAQGGARARRGRARRPAHAAPSRRRYRAPSPPRRAAS